jgi:putative heme-binding domain-containing protein
MKPIFRSLVRALLSRGCVLLVWFCAVRLPAQTPEWIWHDNQGGPLQEREVRFFRKHFTVEGTVTKAILNAAGEDQTAVFLNGRQQVPAGRRVRNRSLVLDVTKELKPGDNVLAVRGQNFSGNPAFIVRLELTFTNDQKRIIVSDPTWDSSAKLFNNWFTPEFVATDWTRPISRGQLGDPPWGDLLGLPTATTAEKLTVLPGFKVELVRSAEPGEGSWVSMTIDPKGRLIISPQEGIGNMLRATLTPGGQIEKLEKLNSPVGAAMGLLHAFDSLYVSGNGPRGLGLYRLRDTNGDDQFDEVRLLKRFDSAGGEHGSHALALGPDKKLYYMQGNFVKVPSDISASSPHRNYAEDQLLPRAEDGNGFGVGLKPPGGSLLRAEPDGTSWEIIAGGLRNTYDFAFNADGEMFGFDSDMEWDWGMPWYRPTRIYHLVSGGEYGFREGTGKLPRHYPDTLPPVLNVGIGSPTGVKFGTGSNYPPKYQRALYAMDWSYGRIFAIHLSSQGATYRATAEEFLRGPRLNVTDLEFGQDGAMYFLTGGRGTQSGLYRVSSVSEENAQAQTGEPESKEATESRALRRQLEAFHGRKDPAAVDFAWPHLNSADRSIRYAARIAIESQNMALWKDRALAETQTDARFTALLALARLGGKETQRALVLTLQKSPIDSLSESQQLDLLRVLELSFIRQGKPDPDLAKLSTEKLDAYYPAKIWPINRELSQLLIYLQAPGVVAKTLALLEAAPTQEEEIHYLFHLRTLKAGWTLEQRKQYFGWFNRNHSGRPHPPELLAWFKEAGSEYRDGASVPKFIANIKKDAAATLTAAERSELTAILTESAAVSKPATAQPGFVKAWKMTELEPLLSQVAKGRSFQKGKEAYAAAQCLACHRFGNDGGATGPDLTAVSGRFTRRDLLESILEPSKVVSEQFQNITVTKKNGDAMTGRLVEETDAKLVLVVNPLTGEKAEVNKTDVQTRAASKISPMPSGLANSLTKDEVLDLLAYIESGGKPDHAAFAR